MVNVLWIGVVCFKQSWHHGEQTHPRVNNHFYKHVLKQAESTIKAFWGIKKGF